MNNKLNQLFPEEVDYNKKMWKFLESCYSNGWVLRATGRQLSIDHKTVKNILDSCKETETYKIFMSKVEDTVKSFADGDFSSTIFQRYETALQELDGKIKNATCKNDDRLVIQYYKLKLTVLKDQLRASLTSTGQEKTQNYLNKAIESLQDEAWEEYGEKIQ